MSNIRRTRTPLGRAPAQYTLMSRPPGISRPVRFRPPRVSHRPRRNRARNASSRAEPGHQTALNPGIRAVAARRCAPVLRQRAVRGRRFPTTQRSPVNAASRCCRPSVIKLNVCEIESLRTRTRRWRRLPKRTLMLAGVGRTGSIAYNWRRDISGTRKNHTRFTRRRNGNSGAS